MAFPIADLTDQIATSQGEVDELTALKEFLVNVDAYRTYVKTQYVTDNNPEIVLSFAQEESEITIAIPLAVRIRLRTQISKWLNAAGFTLLKDVADIVPPSTERQTLDELEAELPSV